MPAITINIPHQLTKAEARRRIEQGFADARQQPGLMTFQQTWSDDTLQFNAQVLAQTVTGRLHVRDHDVQIEVDLPAFLASMANAIKGRLQRQATTMLEDKRPDRNRR